MRARVLVVALLAACAPDVERSPVTVRLPQPSRPLLEPPRGLEKMRLGLTPYLAPDTMRAGHERLAAFLAKQLAVPVEVSVSQTYGGAIEGLERGEFDLVELSPLSYARAVKKVELRCLVQSIADGSATASAYIFVRDDSPRRTLDDLKGARVGFVDRNSTSGYLYPTKLFKQRGLTMDQFGSVEFLGNHEAVVMAVLEGRVDVGATYQGSFSALSRARGIDPLSFRVIAKTPRTPRDTLCVRKSFPEDAAVALKAALLQLTVKDHVGREILGPLSLNGFTPFEASNYDDVVRLAAELTGE